MLSGGSGGKGYGEKGAAAYRAGSSFLARFGRIKEITGIDFDDKMSIVQVRMLIYLMDMEGE